MAANILLTKYKFLFILFIIKVYTWTKVSRSSKILTQIFCNTNWKSKNVSESVHSKVENFDPVILLQYQIFLRILPSFLEHYLYTI